MKISNVWLLQWLSALKNPATEIGERFTAHTAELEDADDVSVFFQSVFLAKLLEIKDHPAGAPLHIGIFDIGARGKKTIVFGEKYPLAVDEIVPVALGGAKLLSGLEIKISDIRGVQSDGMVCDTAELGFKSTELWKFDAENLIGKNLCEVVPELNDTIFDIDNKSLTHRPDLMGHEGFAREASVIFDQPFEALVPKVSFPSTGEKIAVKIESEKCRRFCAVVVKNVTVQSSPKGYQARLETLGIRAINNWVDITNLVMLEFGKPMHAFDAEKIVGNIIIRPAKKGEKIIALDEEEYELTPDDLVVADAEKILSIAGIMGGLESAITKNTKNIILESANFDPVAIRKTSARLGLRSESSMRFEKSLDPELDDRGIFRALEYAKTLDRGASIAGPVTDEYPQKFSTLQITLDPTLVHRQSGLEISVAEIKKTLEKLGFGVEEKAEKLAVQVPSFRATKDVSIPEDLSEEIIRMHGFDRIPKIFPTLPNTPPVVNKMRDLEWIFRDFFSAKSYQEVYHYAFVAEDDKNFTKLDDYVRVQNPLSEEHRYLRRTLISSMIKPLENELRTHETANFYEIGRVFAPRANEVLPEEKNRFALVKSVIKGKNSEIFFALKADLEAFFQHLNLEVDFVPLEKIPHYVHPSQCAEIKMGIIHLGRIATLHPIFSPTPGSATAFVELSEKNLLEAIESTDTKYQKISAYPPVYRDLSIVLEEKILMSDIKKSAKNASPILRSIDFFDEYRDAEKLGKGLKNLSFHLCFVSESETLDEGAVEKEFSRILQALKKDFSAELRLEFDQKNHHDRSRKKLVPST